MPDHRLTTVPIKDPRDLTAAPTPNLPAVPRVPERQDRTPARCPGRADLASVLPGAAVRKQQNCPSQTTDHEKQSVQTRHPDPGWIGGRERPVTC